MDYNFIYQVELDYKEKELSKFLDFALKKLPEKDKDVVHRASELTIVFVDKDKIQELNNQFRGKDKPTDILSFSAIEEGSLGELVICAEIIEKQAQEHQMSHQEECCYMLIHGVLHLLGYDHEKDDSDAKEMYRLQDSIFNAYFGD